MTNKEERNCGDHQTREIRKIKLKCDECGCEFICHLGELTHMYGTAWAECPQEGCHNVVEVPNGTPEYIEQE